MNQILITKPIYNHKRLLKIQFIFSIVFTVLLIFYNFSTIYSKNQKENFSKNLLNSFNIDLLYSSNNNFTVAKTSNSFSVIGTIEIERLNIHYPIIDTVNDNLLKISPCKFFGSNPNEIGNMCIAAHNYNDERFFSKISSLKYGDVIKIIDSSGITINYSVYDSYETSSSDTSCTSQETNGQKEITLVTCNNTTGNRIIVKAKEYIIY